MRHGRSAKGKTPLLESAPTLCYSSASMLSFPEPQIRALIRLLSDEDARVARTIAGKLAEIGEPAVPLLREAEIEQPEMAARISEILDDIQGQRLEGEFHALSACEDEDLDLETGAFLIAQFADRKSTRLNSSHLVISYAVFCLKKKKIRTTNPSEAYRMK